MTKTNPPGSTNDIQFWGFIQVNLGIIAACAPALKPVVGGVLRLPSTHASGSRSNNYAPGTNGQSKSLSRIRVSTHALGQNRGWERADSDIELDDASFSSQTNMRKSGERIKDAKAI